MKAKHFIFPMLAGFLCACSNDFLPEFDDTCEWNTSLEEIISCNKEWFKSQNIEVVSYKLLTDVKVDSTLFFSKENGYFPVYSKEDSVIKIMNYSKTQSTTVCISNEARKRINTLLEHADDYDLVQLTWRYGTDTFYSIALFNKRTGELEYDNMLFNMGTISRYSGESFALMLGNAELQENINGHDEVYYTESGLLRAVTGVSWHVSGHWNSNTYKTYEDEDYKYYRIVYTYCCDSAGISPYCSAYEGYDNKWMCGSYTFQYNSNYEFIYAIWAGPEGCFDENNLGNLNNMNEQKWSEHFTNGIGRYSHINQIPRKDPLVFKVRKNSNDNDSIIIL